MRLLVVCGFAADEFALAALVAQQRCPAAGAGIAEAGAVGVDFDLFAEGWTRSCRLDSWRHYRRRPSHQVGSRAAGLPAQAAQRLLRDQRVHALVDGERDAGAEPVGRADADFAMCHAPVRAQPLQVTESSREARPPQRRLPDAADRAPAGRCRAQRTRYGLHGLSAASHSVPPGARTRAHSSEQAARSSRRHRAHAAAAPRRGLSLANGSGRRAAQRAVECPSARAAGSRPRAARLPAPVRRHAQPGATAAAGQPASTRSIAASSTASQPLRRARVCEPAQGRFGAVRLTRMVGGGHGRGRFQTSRLCGITRLRDALPENPCT